MARLKLAGLPRVDARPPARADARFFARPLAESPVQRGHARIRSTTREADALTIDDYLIERPSQTVLIRVKGDSMMDAGILDGDLVVVEKRAVGAERGDIVVAIVDNQFTLKRLDLERGQFVLKPENKAYPVDPSRRHARDLRRDGRARAQALDAAARGPQRRALDLDQAIVERRRAAEVGQRLARHRVRVRAVGRELLPPDRRRDDDAGPRAIADARRGEKLPRSLKMRTRSPVAMPRARASSGWISSRGVFSSATNAGRLANDELRKLRAGGEMNASG